MPLDFTELRDWEPSPLMLPLVAEADVEPIKVYLFYEIGQELSAIKRDWSGAVPGRAVHTDLLFASWRLSRLLSGDPIEIHLCRNDAITLQNQINEFTAKLTGRKGDDGADIPAEWTEIPEWQWKWLQGSIQTFENVLRAELDNAAIYAVPRRGLYSTPALVNDAASAFPDELKIAIQAKAQEDFHAAGRCLAFNLSTAAGFHACRAVEGILEDYYHEFTGKTGTLHGWQDYIDALEAVIGPPKPDQKTLRSLKQIKEFDRNPLAHPRETLTLLGARKLFAISEIAILSMAEEIIAAKAVKAASQPQLPNLAATALLAST